MYKSMCSCVNNNNNNNNNSCVHTISNRIHKEYIYQRL